jgi:hypothetical protein
MVFMLSSCAVEQIVAATSDGPDAGHRTRPCMTNAECHKDEYCAKASCQDIMGGCTHRQMFCNLDLEPVCGCDGLTYYNECWRVNRGVASSTKGECDAMAVTTVTCGGPTHAACPPPAACAELVGDSTCPADPTFTCWVLPPVCGQNAPGELYDNWVPCGPAAPCVNTCNAIRSGVPHYQSTSCP